MKLRRVGTVHCVVGAGPVWDVLDQLLYFVDLTSGLLWRYDPARETFAKWKMQSPIGSLALREGGGAVVALQDGFHRFSFHNNTTAPICNPQPDDRTQFNDGKVDRCGRFVAGTRMRSLEETAQLGRLYSLDADQKTTQLDEGFGLPNGPCWSPDGRTFYFANSLLRKIFAYDYDLDSGKVSNRRVFADVTPFGGLPDGATVDVEGRVWVAICGGAKIVCFDPQGQVVRVIDMPVPFVSSVMFGGPELDKLYVTSIDGAALGRDVPQDALSGGLFVIDGLGVRGLAEPRFAG
jgi:L-arabinonolactonase